MKTSAIIAAILFTVTAFSAMAKPIVFGYSKASNYFSSPQFQNYIHNHNKDNIIFKKYDSSCGLLQAVSQGKVDYIYSNLSLIYLIKKYHYPYQPILTVLSREYHNSTSRSYSWYLVTQSPKIHKIADLEHKTIGFSSDSLSFSNYVLPKYILQSHNIQYKSFSAISNKALITALKQNKVTAAGIWLASDSKISPQWHVLSQINNIPNPVIMEKTSLQNSLGSKKVVLQLLTVPNKDLKDYIVGFIPYHANHYTSWLNILENHNLLTKACRT